MHTLEDSGFDSEERLSALCEDATSSKTSSPEGPESTAIYLDDAEVSFRGTGLINNSFKDTSAETAEDNKDVVVTQPSNTCRILQRKLELKVERAKRNFNQYQEEQSKKSQSANLIPINRLAIPGDTEPLVDYNSDESAGPEEISFFPARLKHARKQRNAALSDTFSIQEMTIDSDLDSNDSESGNLELLPPQLRSSMLDKFKICFGCVYQTK